jgi:hypothetical protein
MQRGVGRKDVLTFAPVRRTLLKRDNQETPMSIPSRVRDAETLWQEKRKPEALLAALSAANDTARKRYPQAKEGKEALAHFLRDAAVQLAGSDVDLFDWSFRGGVSLGEVLFDVYRSLLENGTLPADVELAPGDQWQIHVLDGNRRAYSDCLIPRLVEIVKRAPENAKEFAKRKR